MEVGQGGGGRESFGKLLGRLEGGGFWEAYGKPWKRLLGDLWEAAGRLLGRLGTSGSFWGLLTASGSSGRRLGSLWEASGKPQESLWEAPGSWDLGSWQLAAAWKVVLGGICIILRPGGACAMFCLCFSVLNLPNFGKACLHNLLPGGACAMFLILCKWF